MQARIGEVAVAHRVRRNGRGLKSGSINRVPLVVEEEEQLVLDDWPADASAELVPADRRFLALRRVVLVAVASRSKARSGKGGVEKVSRLEHIVLDEFVSRTMEAI